MSDLPDEGGGGNLPDARPTLKNDVYDCCRVSIIIRADWKFIFQFSIFSPKDFSTFLTKNKEKREKKTFRPPEWHNSGHPLDRKQLFLRVAPWKVI